MGNLIDASYDILHARNVVNNILSKCESISNKLESEIAQSIDKKSDSIDEKTSSLKIKHQPKLLKEGYELKPYQLIGLNWMCLMHGEKINGILADEMVIKNNF